MPGTLTRRDCFVAALLAMTPLNTGEKFSDMCTSIVEIAVADGMGKGEDGWFKLTHSVVSYDHPHHALLEEAINIDFVNPALGPGARVAVELTLEAAKQLSAALARAITQAEIEEAGRHRGT